MVPFFRLWADRLDIERPVDGRYRRRPSSHHGKIVQGTPHEGARESMPAALTKPESPTPREIGAMPKAYAFERSLGIPPTEACRRAGGRPENGLATKWERSPRVRAWIVYYRSLGNTEE